MVESSAHLLFAPTILHQIGVPWYRLFPGIRYQVSGMVQACLNLDHPWNLTPETLVRSVHSCMSRCSAVVCARDARIEGCEHTVGIVAIDPDVPIEVRFEH